MNNRAMRFLTGWLIGASIMIAFIFFLFVCGASLETEEPVQEQLTAEHIVASVPMRNDTFDTSVLEELWCHGDEDEGTIRMVGAWWYADGLVEDELGDVWSIEQEIDVCDFLLLWIADNGTIDDPTDDIIVKVWREAY